MQTVKELLAETQKKDFHQEFAVVGGPRGFTVVHKSVSGFSCGPFPTPARAQEELTRIAAYLKAFALLLLCEK